MTSDEYYSKPVQVEPPIHYGGDNFATFTDHQHDVCRRPDNHRIDARDMPAYQKEAAHEQDGQHFVPEPVTNKFQHVGTFDACEIFQLNPDLLLSPEELIKRESGNRQKFEERKAKIARGENIPASEPLNPPLIPENIPLPTHETDSEAPLCCFRNMQLPDHIVQDHFVQHEHRRREREHQQNFATGLGSGGPSSNVRDQIMGNSLNDINPNIFADVPKHSAGMLPKVCCEHAMEWHKDEKLRKLCEAPIRKICNVDATRELLSRHMHHQSTGPDGSSYFTNEHSQSFQLHSTHSLLNKDANNPPMQEDRATVGSESLSNSISQEAEDDIETGASTRIGSKRK